MASLSREDAQNQDQRDPLAHYRGQFLRPKGKSAQEVIYFLGNSLGLQPKSTAAAVNLELERWATHAVEGHFAGPESWLEALSQLQGQMAKLVGARPDEVCLMNALTVNLHLLLTSFYRPTKKRFKILVEEKPFSSDLYALQSQIRLHGFDPAKALIEIRPRKNEHLLRTEDILENIDRHEADLSLLLLGHVNFYTGQAFDLASLTKSLAKHAARKEFYFGLDLAHGVGNVPLSLHDWNVDFACWCSYKYLNSGPGALAGIFVHEKHADSEFPRLQGWWSNKLESRFRMGPRLEVSPGAQAWQISNPPILQMACLRASLRIFEAVGFETLRKKSIQLTSFLESLLESEVDNFCEVLSPKDPAQRGAQLSIRIKSTSPFSARDLLSKLHEVDVWCDLREPDVLRWAPVPLYNSFEEVFEAVQRLKKILGA